MRNVIFSTALALCAASASAATLDFTELGAGPTVLGPESVLGTIASVTGATLTSGGSGFLVTSVFPNSICALSVNCANDLTIDFTDLVSGITFDVFGFQAGDGVNVFDAVTVFIYGLNGLLGTVDITGNGPVNLSAFTGVDYLFFDDSSTFAGVAYGNVTYTVAAPVPLPASLSLLLLGFGALTFLRRRRL